MNPSHLLRLPLRYRQFNVNKHWNSICNIDTSNIAIKWYNRINKWINRIQRFWLSIKCAMAGVNLLKIKRSKTGAINFVRIRFSSQHVDNFFNTMIFNKIAWAVLSLALQTATLLKYMFRFNWAIHFSVKLLAIENVMRAFKMCWNVSYSQHLWPFQCVLCDVLNEI